MGGVAAERRGLPGLEQLHPGPDPEADLSGALALELADAATADAVCAAVRVITAATSLGGVESTLERRTELPAQQHLPPGLLRLSVGCEHLEDLWADLVVALGQQVRREGSGGV